MKIYLVGGAVRDQLRGLQPTDLDFVVVGAPADRAEDWLQSQIPGLTRVGQRIPVFVRGTEQYTISACARIEDDLATRDVTINALAQDEGGHIIAHPLALQDLEAKILRPVSVDNFLADPLRVVRAARFSAAFSDFTLAPELILAMQAVSVEALGQMAAERVGQETLKACVAERPGNFLRTLLLGESLRPWFMEFATADGIPAGPATFHNSSVLEHTAKVMDGCSGDSLAVWMALCHDLGKTTTPRSLWPRHFGHEERGAALAKVLGARLRLSSRFIQAGQLAARWHMAGGYYSTLRAATKIRLLVTLDKVALLTAFFQVVVADGGANFLEQAQHDLALIKSVILPAKHRDQGHKSAEVLLQLRCEALARKGHEF